MFGIKNLFRSAKKVQNQNTLEALVAGCMLVASADGTVERQEVERMEKLLSTNDNLSAFKPAEIRKLTQRYQTRLEADFLVGRKQMEKEISDISDDHDQAEEVILNMIAIAKADGEIEPEEATEIKRISRLLGVDVSEYGIA